MNPSSSSSATTPVSSTASIPFESLGPLGEASTGAVGTRIGRELVWEKWRHFGWAVFVDDPDATRDFSVRPSAEDALLDVIESLLPE